MHTHVAWRGRYGRDKTSRPLTAVGPNAPAPRTASDAGHGGAIAAASMAACLLAARAGDPAAMERLLLPYEASLIAMCRGILLSPEDAEDAVQETFLRALRSLDRYRGEASFKTWLTQIAINVCLDQKRARRAEVALSDCANWPEANAHHDQMVPSPEERALSQALAAEALLTLNPRRRAAFLLRETEGWSAREIGDALGWGEGRVKVELYRARRALLQWAHRQQQQEQEEGAER